MTYTAKDIESATDLILAADIGYWTRMAEMDNAGNVTICEDDDDAKPVTFTPADLLDWLATDGPVELIKQIHDAYQKNAINDTRYHNWDDWDYDVETGDLILQQMLLGEVRYG